MTRAPSGEQRLIVSNPGPDLGGMVSPDGGFLAYTAGTPGTAYVTSYPDAARTWTVSSVGGTAAGVRPSWSRDGTRLYYQDSGMLWSARIEADPDFRLGERTPLFPLGAVIFQQHFDLYPDGEHFAVIRGGLPPGGQIIVITNWISDLIERGVL